MARKKYDPGPLHTAVMLGDAAWVTSLLADGRAPDPRDDYGRTPLMYAALGGRTEILAALIAAGGDVNAKDRREWTSLHFAAQDRRAEAAAMLLDGGAMPDVGNEDGNTPLWVAVMHAAGDLRVAALLVGRGADPDRKNRHGVSARELATGDPAATAALVDASSRAG